MNTIKHTEYKHNGRRVILDTCELAPGKYETMLLYPNGHEIACFQLYANRYTSTGRYERYRRVCTSGFYRRFPGCPERLYEIQRGITSLSQVYLCSRPDD